MFCYKCGTNMPDGATFCTNCGAALAAPPVVNAPSTGVPPPPRVGAESQQSVPPAQPAPVLAQAPPRYIPPVAQETAGKATASMIFGILSLIILPIIGGIIAVVLGHMALSEIKKSMGRLKGQGMAVAGLVMGYLNVAMLPFILIIAAIAIPNLLKAKITANNSAAAATVRTIVTTQVTYSMEYPTKGFAPDLATLGSGQGGSCATPSARYACLIDNSIAAPQCTSTNWCTKGGFQFLVTGLSCESGACSDYLAIATPVNSSTGTRAFCTSSDAVVRWKDWSVSSSLPTTPAECETWEAL